MKKKFLVQRPLPILLTGLLLLVAGCSKPDSAAPTSSRTVQLTVESTTAYTPTLEGPVRALSLSPVGRMQSLPRAQRVSITFTKPMVPLGDASKPDRSLVTIFPDVAGELQWHGTQTLVFTPESPLTLSTEYIVRISPGLVSVDGDSLEAAIEWSFSTPSPEITSTVPSAGYKHVRPADTLRVFFNQPVNAGVAEDFIQLIVNDRTAIGTTVFNSSPNALAVVPNAALPLDAKVILKIGRGLPAVAGNIGMQSDALFEMTTYGPGRLLSISPGSGSTVFAPGSGFVIEFNNPVSMASLERSITMKPEATFTSGTIPDVKRQATSLRWPVELSPSTEYEVAVSGLSDVFGQSIPNVVKTFRTAAYRPEISLPSGILVVEGTQRHNLSVSAVNVRDARVGLKRISADEIVPNLLGFVAPYPDLYVDDEQARDADRGFQMRPLDLSAAQNEWKTNPIALEPALIDGRGIVLVNAYVPKQTGWYGGRSYRSIAQVTEMGITAKYSPHQMLAFVSDLSTASGITGVKVSIRDNENSLRWSGVTDAKGLVSIPGWDSLGFRSENEWTRPGIFVIAEKNGDVAFASSEVDRGIEPYRLGVSYDWSPAAENFAGSVFSDRGLYRTGETVSLKAILRQRADADWQVYSDTAFVVISSPRDERVLVRSFVPSDFGAIDWQWTIPDDAAQGTYYVRVSDREVGEEDYYDAGIGSGYFRVDAFRTSTFAVDAAASASEYVAGDFFEGSIVGRYLFGAAMGGQPASYSLTRSATYYRPKGYDDFLFGGRSAFSEGPDLYRRIARADTVLDAEGRLPMRVQLPGNEFGQVTAVALEGTVTDPARQALSGRVSVTLHPGLFYIGLRPKTTFLDLSKSTRQTVDVIAVDPRGVPVEARDVGVAVYLQQWTSIREVGADGRLRWRSERSEELITTATVSIAQGSAEQVSFTVPQGGSYIIRATSNDLRGNSIQTESYFYATGSGYVAWERSDDDRIELIANKSSYGPGDVATILIPSPYESAKALITVEREGIITSRVETLTGSAPKIDIPLTDVHIPNAFVSVILLSGRTAPPSGMQDLGAPGFKIGYVNLAVDAGARHLKVLVQPSAEIARPGDELTVELSVRDRNNRGVPAEITFSAADAGVLNLIGYALPDPFDAFYGQRSLGVSTTESRSHLVRQRNFGQKEEDSGGGGGGQSDQMRTDFRPLAHWDPSIRTDASGNATITFRLPESLTTFRLMATAATIENEFGYDAAEVVVTKPLVLQKALPRFARLGDTFTAGVLISNRTGSDGVATITASQSGIGLSGEKVVSVALEEGETREVAFTWNADEVNEATLEFAARLAAETDALRVTVPIVRPTTKITTATLSQTDSSTVESIKLPVNRIASLDRLSTTMASTSLVGVHGAVEYLFEYPYGCLEQRTSRIRPILIASDLVDSFDLTLLAGESDKLVRTWLSDLNSFWTGSGFSLWPGGNYAPPYLNAYVVAALAEASAAGYDVPERLRTDAINEVEYMARRRSEKPAYYSTRSWNVSRAFMLFALAQHDRVLEDEIAALATEELKSQQAGSIETVAYLLRTIARVNSPVLDRFRDPLLDRMRSSLTVEATTAYAEIPDEEDYWWVYSSTTRATALAATTLTVAAPEDEAKLLGQRLINHLLGKRSSGYWASTQENVAVVEAMGAYFERFEQSEPDFSATISVFGKEVATEAFRGRSTLASNNDVDLSAFPDALSLPLEITKSGIGTLFYSLQLDTYLNEPQPAATRGLTVTRSIQRLNNAGETVGEDELVGSDPIALDAGQLVRVTLRLNSRANRNYVVVDDALPAGLEALNAAFETTNQEQTNDSGTSRWWGSFNYSEIKDDRVLLFADFLERGDHTFRYVARATTPGSFAYPAVQSELMYQPSVNGRTATGRLTVR